jgi:nucleotide-binding universal stress UspA family protein
VPRRGGGIGPSFGWLDEAPNGDGFVGSYGRVFDVTVVGRPDPNRNSPRMSTLEAALFDSGRPILIAPPTPPPRLGDVVVIAWNGSTETARTVAFALPLLEQAERVVVLTVEGWMVPGPSGEQLARYLRANGIAAEPLGVPAGRRNNGETVLANAAALGCDLLVKGAYTQSRLRQMIFGGATAHILARAEMPVLMAH